MITVSSNCSKIDVFGIGGILSASAETSTVTASKVGSEPATWTGTAEETWTVTVVDGATNQNVTNGYAQIGTSKAPSTSITLSTSDIAGTITSIVVDCAAYQGNATISATVGGEDFGEQSQSVPSWSNNAGGNVTFEGSAPGAIVITMTNGSSGRAMYIKSITVNYTSASPDEPYITLSAKAINVDRDGADGTLTVNYNNFSEVVADIAFYGADGETTASYDWITAEINSDNNVYYVIEANEGEARTAYMKVYALDNEAEEVYSDLITITQAKGIIINDGEIDFANFAEGYNYGSDCTHGSAASGDHTWISGNVTFELSGRHALSNGTQLRLYKAYEDAAAGQITITAGGKSITNIVLDLGSNKNITTEGFNDGIWEGNATSVVITVSDRTDINKITVTYETPTATITDAQWATYVAADNVYFPEGCSAYIVTAINETSVVLTEVLAVEQGTPVVLNGEQGEYELETVEAADCDDVTANMLRVVAESEAYSIKGGVYVLTRVDGVVGFYKYEGTNGLPAGRVYLQPASDGNARNYLSIGPSEATGIESLEAADVLSNEVFDLQGRRVGKAVKGLYIVNGKKMIIK